MNLRWIPTVLAVNVVCCGQRPHEGSWYDEHLGVAIRKSGQACLSVANRSLRQGTDLRVVATNPPTTSWRARVVREDASCLPGPDADAGLAGYDIAFEGAMPPESFPLIALIDQPPPLPTSNGAAVTDPDASLRDELLRSCTSNEGVHFTAWSDAPLTGTRRWHRYYYLGYDVEPNCTANEVR